MKLHSNHYVDLEPFSSAGRGNCDGIKITVEGIPQKFETDRVRIGNFTAYKTIYLKTRTDGSASPKVYAWAVAKKYGKLSTPIEERIADNMTQEDAIRIAEFLAVSEYTGSVRRGLTLELV